MIFKYEKTTEIFVFDNFSTIVDGFKKELLQLGGTQLEANLNDCDPQTRADREEKFKFYKSAIVAINKRFVNTSTKNRHKQLPESLHSRPLLDFQTREMIQNKINVSIEIQNFYHPNFYIEL